MNVSAINSVKNNFYMPNMQLKVSNPVKNTVKSDYQYSALDKMSALGMSQVTPHKSLAVSFTGWKPEAKNKETIEKMVKIMKDPNVKKIAVSEIPLEANSG